MRDTLLPIRNTLVMNVYKLYDLYERIRAVKANIPFSYVSTTDRTEAKLEGG